MSRPRNTAAEASDLTDKRKSTAPKRDSERAPAGRQLTQARNAARRLEATDKERPLDPPRPDEAEK